MRIIPYISSSLAPRFVLLVSYMMALAFGNGLHVHESLRHEHDGTDSHTHSWTAHVHQSMVTPSGTAKSQIRSTQEQDHLHPVPVVQLIAGSAPTSSQKHPSQRIVVASVGVERISTFFPLFSFLFLFPRETLPPLSSWTGLLDSGRAPPTR